jgi:ADP-ribosylglycohydrolase
VRGAQATAAAIFLARTGADKDTIRREVRGRFGYPLRLTVDEIRPNYRFNESCQGTVPEAITSFLESTDFEDAIRNAVSLGGDAETLACITGAIAEPFYGGVPEAIAAEVRDRLPSELLLLLDRFLSAHPPAHER